VITF
jgi:hypothetical protein